MFELVHAFSDGLFLVLSWNTFSLMLLGIAVGFAVGILPGLGGPVAIVLMLPFIFRMEAVEAFAFLLSMSAVTATTGDITSILFGIPGEATTASTIVDGYPMAKKGEAGRALGAALMSSLVGAIFGALCLALAVPIMQPLVLAIGSPELFMLSLLGITFLASLSGNALVKGLLASALGLQISTIGLNPFTGTERYTFEQLYLWDGVRLVPATLGLFAIPEIIDLWVKGTSIAERYVGKLGGVMEGVVDTFRHWRLVLRCSALGTYIGVIPGMGGAVSQWVAYAHAVQSSPDRERFGKGAVEGVLGPGAANNSTLGGALIPTIAFGVPGSVSTAILLGAFLIQGLVPGPPMLLPASQGGHLDLTFSFVWIVVLSNLITVAACFLFLNPLAKITQVRGALVIPFLLLFVYLGGFAENNSFGDLIVVLCFGILGWILNALDWPRPPLVLGLVLGPLIESNLFLSTNNYGLAWLTFPGVLFLALILLAGVLYPVYQRVREKKQPENDRALQVRAMEEARPTVCRRHVVLSAALVVLFAWALWESRDWGFRAGLFPWWISGVGLILAVIQLSLDGRNYFLLRQGDAQGSAVSERAVIYRTVSIWCWIGGFFGAIWLLGFDLAVPLLTFSFLKLSGRERWPITLGLTLLIWMFLYGLFDYTLQIPFPPGQLQAWLKL